LVTESSVAKTASGEQKRNICPLAKWGMEQLSAYKGDFATRTSGLKKKCRETRGRSVGRRRGAGSMLVSSGSHGVGKALDGELAQLVPRAVLTSAQTDAVIPCGTAPSLAARVR
jgi:hypothetical protein